MPTERRLLSRRSPAAAAPQRGITLIVVLILLVVVTVLGIGGTRIALLSERSTRFDRDYQVAWQAAEAALIDAEYDIAGPNTSSDQRLAAFAPENEQDFVPNCGTTYATRGLCQPSATATPVWASINFMDASNTAPTVAYGSKTGFPFVSGAAGVQPALPPRYIIERAPYTPLGGSAGIVQHSSMQQPPVIYRVTSIGFGPNQQVQVLMQSTFSRGVN